MDKRFQGQVAVVMGGADGLGKGISKRLADEGATVVIVDADEQRLSATLEEFRNSEGISGFRADISDEESVKRTFEQVAQRYGKLDVLVNSAGIVGPTSTPITEYDAV